MRYVLGFVMLVAVSGCTRSVGGGDPDGGGGQPDALGATGSDGAPLAVDAQGDLENAPSDGGGGQVADLACLAAVYNPFGMSPCEPGMEQHSTDPMGCYKKICGCTNQATCTGCYWSPWMQVTCP